MNHLKTALVLATASAALASGAYAQDTYTIDNTHAHIGFEIPHMVISNVKGAFNEYEASLTLKDDKLQSAEATLQVSSIDTKNKKRDEHLKSGDFFDAKGFPAITFKSTGVSQKAGKHILTGDLTIRDVTKSVNLTYILKGPVKDPWGNTKVGLEAGTIINRKDFGLTWSKALESGGLVVGNAVTLKMDMEFAKQ